MSQHLAEIRACLDAAQRRDATIAGRLVMRFEIAPDGSVRSAAAVDPDARLADVGRCIAASIATWRFPERPSQGPMIVTYPFDLTARASSAPATEVTEAPLAIGPTDPTPSSSPPSRAAEATDSDEPLTHDPAPGRFPVEIESAGVQQTVTEVLTNTGVVYSNGVVGVIYRQFCRTPCVGYARPGRLQLASDADGIRTSSATLEVPPGGLHVRLYASPFGPALGGAFLVTIAVLGSLVAIPVAIYGAADLNSSYPPRRTQSVPELAIGAGGLGVALIAFFIGYGLLAAYPGGVQSATPLVGGSGAPAHASRRITPRAVAGEACALFAGGVHF